MGCCRVLFNIKFSMDSSVIVIVVLYRYSPDIKKWYTQQEYTYNPNEKSLYRSSIPLWVQYLKHHATEVVGHVRIMDPDQTDIWVKNDVNIVSTCQAELNKPKQYGFKSLWSTDPTKTMVDKAIGYINDILYLPPTKAANLAPSGGAKHKSTKVAASFVNTGRKIKIGQQNKTIYSKGGKSFIRVMKPRPNGTGKMATYKVV